MCVCVCNLEHDALVNVPRVLIPSQLPRESKVGQLLGLLRHGFFLRETGGGHEV